jgi:hypothetical protein
LLALSIVCWRADKENEPKERAPVPLAASLLVLRTALRSSKLPGFCKLASLHGDNLVRRQKGPASLTKFKSIKKVYAVGKADKQRKILFGSFSGAQQVATGNAKRYQTRPTY